jgi:hypothetical protein
MCLLVAAVLPELPETPICLAGDLWILGDHRLLELESFGLATRVETGVPWEPSVFRPLDFGYKFIEYIHGSAKQEAAT